MTKRQSDALRIAATLRSIDPFSIRAPQRLSEAATELERLSASNDVLRAGYHAARLEIASLQAQLDAVGAGGVGRLVLDARPGD